MSRVIDMKNVMLVMCCIFIPLVAMAEPTYDEYGDLIRPEAEKFSGIFEGFGPKTDGAQSIIAINDTKYRVDNETFYRNARGGKSSLSRFKKGMLVDYYAIEYLVTNLSVSASPDEPGGDSHIDQSSPEPVQNDIHQEGGVWQN